MHKQMLIAIGAVCVIALVATGVVVMQKDDAPAVDQGILPAPVAPPQRTVVAPPPPPVNLPRAELPVATVSNGIEDDEVSDVASAPTAASGDNEALRARISSMLDNMSDEERQALGQELARRGRETMRDNMRYGMASDMRLRVLGRNAETRLTAEQEAQVQALRDDMRPKVDDALSSIWSQSEELRNQARTLREQGLDMTDINAQSNQLRQTEREIRQRLDAEFQTALKTVLTPAQSEALESAPTWGGGNAAAGRRGGGNRGP